MANKVDKNNQMKSCNTPQLSTTISQAQSATAHHFFTSKRLRPCMADVDDDGNSGTFIFSLLASISTSSTAISYSAIFIFLFVFLGGGGGDESIFDEYEKKLIK
ncbi:hypothetical protein DERF_011776 [Dermatophagoides farinae]|uniref:Transmembrane protein n=1 Tax=Dermatophagoides farinae TaxID=6954 RepID=A0A922HWQ6_DERFA|nr:hypothetical protein DERF_011776 [Dermatophagoides farinae]